MPVIAIGGSAPRVTRCGLASHNACADLLVRPPQVPPQVARVLDILQGEMSREQRQAALQLTDRKSFRVRYLQPALAEGLIEYALPDAPSSRLQRYRLTDRGQLTRDALRAERTASG